MTEETDVEKIKEGIQLIYNKLMKILDDQGVKKIESIGKPFDVEFHSALMQRADDSVPPHTVLDELETGYMYRDRVIRHAKVIVSEG
jgi:molecular chaperone GrpE